MSQNGTNPLVDRALAYCEANGHRLTPPRLAVITIMAENRALLGAYDVLEKLAHVLPNPKPPTAYRAIDFWLKHGFIHRVESRNAYIICTADHHHHSTQVMICDGCDSVTETHLCDLPEAFQQKTQALDFQPTRWTMEIFGLCAKCQGEAT